MSDFTIESSTREVEHTAPYSSDRRSRRQIVASWLTFAPMALASFIAIFVSIDSMQSRLLMPFPQTPWETSIVAEGFRFAHGVPVYTRPSDPNGHAMHMYGPLTSLTLGALYTLTHKTNLFIGRTFTLSCALILCAILLHVFTPRRRTFALFLGAGLLLALHYRGRAYFVETRPDMVAALFATLAILLFYRATTNGTVWLYFPGAVMAVAAMLFKQTYGAFAAVPIVAFFLTRDVRKMAFASLRRNILLAVFPLVACIGTVALIRVFMPYVYFYMVTVPTLVEVKIDRLGLAIVSLLTLAPLFVALAVWYVLMPRDPVLHSTKMRWLIAALFVGCAAGLLPFAKRGGTFNSLLLGWIPATAFCIAMLDPMLRRLASLRGSFAGIVCGWLIALLLLVTTLDVPNSETWNFAPNPEYVARLRATPPRATWWDALFSHNGAAHGSAAYRDVIAAVKHMHSNAIVICPEDPTILMQARGTAGRCLEAELDAVGRKDGVPVGVANDIAQANYLIRVHGNFDEFFTPEMMKELGFERLPDAYPFKKFYSLWKRISEPTTRATTPPTRERRKLKY